MPRSPLSLILILAVGSLSALSLTQPLNAASRFWDQTAGAGNGVGGSATWTSQTDARWSTTSTGDAALTSAAATDAGIFQGTAGTVTIAGDLTLASWTWSTTNYVLTPSSATLRTLTGPFSLAASVNLNIGAAAKTTDDTLSLVGSGVTGGAGSGLTLQGAQTASGSNVRILLSQAGASIDTPITFGGAGTTFAGVVANATGTGITGAITNNSSFITLLGATVGNDLTLSSTAVISGSAGLQIGVTNSSVNVGSVTLNAASTYGGGTTLNGGTLVLGNDSALSTNTLTLSNSSTSVLQASSARTLANNIVWGGNGTLSGGSAFTFNGAFTSSGSASRSITVNNTGGATFAGNVFLAPDNTTARGLTINGSNDVLVSGVIANNNSGNTLASTFSKSGTNTVTLTNANTYTGATAVTNGSLIINGNQSGATGAVSSVGSAAILGGIGTIGGATSIGSATSGGNITGATNGTIGILNLASTAQFLGASANLATYAVDIGGTASDKLAITGTLDLNGAFDQISFNQLGALTGMSYTLATYASETGVFDTVTGLPGGYTLVYTPTELDLVATPVPEASTWVAGALIALTLLVSQRRRVLKPATVRA